MDTSFDNNNVQKALSKFECFGAKSFQIKTQLKEIIFNAHCTLCICIPYHQNFS